MPIHGVSGRTRTPRNFKLRLGYKKPGQNHPTDTDVFIGRLEDGLTKATIEAYGGSEIAGAEKGTYALGKYLRLLLPWEFDATEPVEGREIALSLGNYAWARSRLRCSGDGGSSAPGEVGTATCRDEEWATRIVAKVGGEKRVKVEGKSWEIPCLGIDCPKYFSNPAGDEDKACRHTMRLQAELLHPETDPEAPDYLKRLGWVEIVSGSWNGMLDVQSGFRYLRSIAHRTAHIPFYLRRSHKIILRETADGKGQRIPKHTLGVDFDTDEALTFAYSDPSRSLLRPAIRQKLLELAQAEVPLMRLAAAPPDYESFRDLDQPGVERRQLSEATVAPTTPTAPADNGSGDREEVVAAAAAAAPEPTEPSEDELNRFLTQGERDELKKLAGPLDAEHRPATINRLLEYVAEAFIAFGEDVPEKPLGNLTVRHKLWIEEALAGPRPDPDEVRALSGELLEERAR